MLQLCDGRLEVHNSRKGREDEAQRKTKQREEEEKCTMYSWKLHATVISPHPIVSTSFAGSFVLFLSGFHSPITSRDHRNRGGDIGYAFSVCAPLLCLSAARPLRRSARLALFASDERTPIGRGSGCVLNVDGTKDHRKRIDSGRHVYENMICL